MVELSTAKVFNHLNNLDSEPEMVELINYVYSETGYKISPQTDMEIIHAYGKTDGGVVSSDSGFQAGVMLPKDVNSDIASELTLPTDNSIDSVYIHKSGFSEDVRVWGQTLTDDKFSKMFTQDATFNGNNFVSLTTPLARVWKMEALGPTGWVAAASAVDSSVGKPDGSGELSGLWADNEKVFITSMTLNNDYEPSYASKATYTVPDGYILIFKKIHVAHIRGSTNNFVEGSLQVREYGKTFINKFQMARQMAANIGLEDYPFVYALPNSDVRIKAQISGGTNSECPAGFTAILIPILGTS